ncbi:MAG: hypothetical protein BRD29_00890 [Bacteroidetes bacterium QH_2_67_10]|nr:MAG: hypothetical protein BRD29_00890 [Bacteroidetes bacterium QH_2_67_10]
MNLLSCSPGRLPTALAGCAFLAVSIAVSTVPVAAQTSPVAPTLVDDFESYDLGTRPEAWKYITRSRDAVALSEAIEKGREDVRVRQEDGNQFVRLTTRNDALRITQRGAAEFDDWNADKRPYLQWRWRALHLPQGADKQDTGAAVLVTFDSDWLGRPKNIKYAYSTEYPVGKTIDEGNTHVIVVASGQEDDTGEWKTETRNVVEDIENHFGQSPPYESLAITLWSDSDEVHDRSKADFENIRLLSERP